jgi:tetratricopeptide (TPR) repeat protein
VEAASLLRSIPIVILVVLLLAASGPSPIRIEYPAPGTTFPPEIAAPTFLWRDSAKTAVFWRVNISFPDGAPALHSIANGERLRVGPIDRDCIAPTNQPPTVPDFRAWVPDAFTWAAIKKHRGATVTFMGFAGSQTNAPPVSRGSVDIRTSRDPVGAPIFYRDVPLMPTQTKTGVIQPLADEAVRLIAWRIRNIAEPRSRVLLEGMPVCANCHSFSADGSTLGMDLDGLQKNRGLYTLTPVARQTLIRKENVIQWSTAEGRLKGALRVGFMSQVSPHGDRVITTIDSPDPASKSPSNYYVANFQDYRFLQVFYPTRGILAWYSRATGILQPLPGADDPRYVQTNAVWSPDGQYLIFARALKRDPNPIGVPLAAFANDPHELQIQYDLYRIPFNDGKGGTPEPVGGASANGFSNTFPRVSPDGRWIVFVRCRNGLLMRPDSELYIVPAGGGTARRLDANTARMNSWHSFSPNGRWLVFSSKARSPYTQMYLTHIDEAGNSTPPVLIENSTAANRAVNIPEFVNNDMRELGGPALDYYKLFDRAMYFQRQKRYAESAAWWKKVLEIAPDDAQAHRNLALVLLMDGKRQEAGEHLRQGSAAQ